MRIITIRIPKKGNRWAARMKVDDRRIRGISRITAGRLYGAIERYLLASKKTKKTHIIVRYGVDQYNDGIYDNKYELLYVLSCFLEDYLPRNHRLPKEKEYLKMI